MFPLEILFSIKLPSHLMILLFLYCEQAVNLFVLVRVFCFTLVGPCPLGPSSSKLFASGLSKKLPQVESLDPTGLSRHPQELVLVVALTCLRNLLT